MRIICCREVLVKEDRKSLMAQMVMMNDAALKETEVKFQNALRIPCFSTPSFFL